MLDYITWAANPEIFSGFVTIRWYGLMFAIGFLIGYELVAKMFKHEGAHLCRGGHDSGCATWPRVFL